MAAIRFLHNFDLIACEMGANNHKGKKPRFDVPPEDKVDAEGKHDVDFRIVTVPELMAVNLFGCPDVPAGQATRIASIMEGKAKAVLIRGKIPLLVSLVAIEAGTGHLVRVAIDYSSRMAGAEGAKKHVYLDTATPKRKTVGIGFNMDKPGAKAEFDSLLGTGGTSHFDDVRGGTADLTEREMITMLDDAKPSYEAAARREVSSFDTQSPERQAALMELEANMGSIAGFKNMIAAINGGDYKKAAYELLHGKGGGPSKFATDVHEGRANNVAGALRWRIVGSPAAVEGVDDPAMSAEEAAKIA